MFAAESVFQCNVVIRTDNGRTIVEALDPKLIAEVPGNPALTPIAEEAGQRINAALDALGNRPDPALPSPQES